MLDIEVYDGIGFENSNHDTLKSTLVLELEVIRLFFSY